ncbi:hypothetical protein ACSQ67_022901 [Phaseolus vulgaris]
MLLGTFRVVADEFCASSSYDSLHSLGVAADDLIFYSLNHIALSLETLPHKQETASQPTHCPKIVGNPRRRCPRPRHLKAYDFGLAEVEPSKWLMDPIRQWWGVLVRNHSL